VIERQLPYWYVHTWDRTRDAQRSFRLDRMRSARMQRETFEPREGFRPDHLGAGVGADLVLEEDARWKAEEGARLPRTAAPRPRRRQREWSWQILADRRGRPAEPDDLRKGR
jgi:predicted DNA-binding transcriptional regulator YafY